MENPAEELGIMDGNRTIVGGESAGGKAELDIYDTEIHAFDMLYPDKEISKQVIAILQTPGNRRTSTHKIGGIQKAADGSSTITM